MTFFKWINQALCKHAFMMSWDGRYGIRYRCTKCDKIVKKRP